MNEDPPTIDVRYRGELDAGDAILNDEEVRKCHHTRGMKRRQTRGLIEAINDGHSACMKYVFACGAPLSSKVLEAAIERRRYTCALLLIEMKCPGHDNDRVYRYVICNDMLDMFPLAIGEMVLDYILPHHKRIPHRGRNTAMAEQKRWRNMSPVAHGPTRAAPWATIFTTISSIATSWMSSTPNSEGAHT